MNLPNPQRTTAEKCETHLADCHLPAGAHSFMHSALNNERADAGICFLSLSLFSLHILKHGISLPHRWGKHRNKPLYSAGGYLTRSKKWQVVNKSTLKTNEEYQNSIASAPELLLLFSSSTSPFIFGSVHDVCFFLTFSFFLSFSSFFSFLFFKGGGG